MASRSTLVATAAVGVALGIVLTRALDRARRRQRNIDRPHDDAGRALGLGARGREIHRHLSSTQKPAAALGVRVERYDEGDGDDARPALTLSAPLSSNTNVHGSAFAGSLFGVAVLCGYYAIYAWLIHDEQEDDLRDCVLVVRSASIRYRRPVIGCSRIVARSSQPEKEVLDGFRAELLARGKADIDCKAEICLDDGTVACECDVRLCAYRRGAFRGRIVRSPGPFTHALAEANASERVQCIGE